MLFLHELAESDHKGTPLKVQARCHCHDDRVLWIDLRGGQLPSDNDGVDQVFGVLWDITDSKTQQLALAAENTRLEQADRIKDDVIARLGHELRTPLSAIIGYADLALDHANDEDLRAEITEIHSNGRFTLHLMEDLLDLSRITTDKIELNPKPMDLTQLVKDLQASTQILTTKKGIAFDVESANNLPTSIVTDALRLRQILQNLLDNAVKFTDQGGIHFSVKKISQGKGKTLVFEVSDTGPGISQKDYYRVFEPFVQLRHDAARRGGLGIGLALSRQLAACLGGCLEVDSTDGEGSRFRLYLPVQLPSSVSLPPDKRILLIEDHDALAQMTRRQLKAYGYAVRVARNGTEATQLVMEWRPDAVITDLSLPDICGQALISSLKKMVQTKNCRFIAYTGSSDPNDRQAAITAGFDAYFIKPTDVAELVSAVEIR